MAKTKFFIRNMEAGKLLEAFLIVAIASVLITRFYLHVAGYPQLGGGRYHIAHMLWGGFLMLIALILLFGFLGKSTRQAATVIGGVGFGLFIDELGKFITRDNDYFFQPAVAIIYVIFILLFLGLRRLEVKKVPDETESLANAIDIFEEGAMYGLDEEEKQRALALLGNISSSNPEKDILRRAIIRLPLQPAGQLKWYKTAKEKISSAYGWIIGQKLFVPAIIGLVIFQSVYKIIEDITIARQPVLFGTVAIIVTFIIFHIIEAIQNRSNKFKAVFYALVVSLVIFGLDAFLDNIKTGTLRLHEWGEILSSTASALLTIYGAVRLKWNRLASYVLFERAILVSIFITQFFTFYRAQLNAVVGLAVNLLLLWGTQILIKKQKAVEPVSVRENPEKVTA